MRQNTEGERQTCTLPAKPLFSAISSCAGKASSDRLFADLNHEPLPSLQLIYVGSKMACEHSADKQKGQPSPKCEAYRHTNRVEPKRRLGFFVRKSHIA